MRITTIIERQKRSYLVMLHDGRVLKAQNQIAAKAFIDAESKRLMQANQQQVVNSIEWRGVRRLAKEVR